ncbi:MAG: protein tyrosine phosphatase family protein [Pseudomonadota bacterium]
MTNPKDPSDIRNWQRRPDGITTSGKLNPHDPARLSSIGVKHVINLALDDHPEALPSERELLEEAGIRYTHIPVPFDAPRIGHVRAMHDAIKAANGPVHVHCIMNYRVTAFFYILDRESGVPEPEARARMAEVWDPLGSSHNSAQSWKELIIRQRN